MTSLPLGSVADTIIDLAGDIARASPESAEKAMHIVDLAQEIDRQPDRAAVEEAIEASLLDTDASETRIKTTTSAVLAAVRDPLDGSP